MNVCLKKQKTNKHKSVQFGISLVSWWLYFYLLKLWNVSNNPVYIWWFWLGAPTTVVLLEKGWTTPNRCTVVWICVEFKWLISLVWWLKIHLPVSLTAIRPISIGEPLGCLFHSHCTWLKGRVVLTQGEHHFQSKNISGACGRRFQSPLFILPVLTFPILATLAPISPSRPFTVFSLPLSIPTYTSACASPPLSAHLFRCLFEMILDMFTILRATDWIKCASRI